MDIALFKNIYFLKKINKKYNYDIFILQFCSNDFGSNVFEIDTLGNNFNQFFKRPYLSDNGKIIYHEGFISNIFKTKFIGESKFFNKILFLFSKYKNQEDKNNSDINLIDKKSIDVTINLLNKIRSLIKSNQAYMVNCDNSLEGANKNWKNIALQSNFIPLDFGNKAIEKSIKNNEKVFYIDHGHFNNLGNKLYGEAIFEQLKNFEKFNF